MSVGLRDSTHGVAWELSTLTTDRIGKTRSDGSVWHVLLLPPPCADWRPEPLVQAQRSRWPLAESAGGNPFRGPFTGSTIGAVESAGDRGEREGEATAAAGGSSRGRGGDGGGCSGWPAGAWPDSITWLSLNTRTLLQGFKLCCVGSYTYTATTMGLV
jgi:hypothetical protein